MGNKTSSARSDNEAGCFSGLTDRRSRQAPNPTDVDEGATEVNQQTFVERPARRDMYTHMQLPDRTTAAMFESAQNTQIHGGTFTAQHGPHATLTVNIHNNGSQTQTASQSIGYQATGQGQRIYSLQDRPLPDVPSEEHSRNSDHRRLVDPPAQCFQRSNELYEQQLLQKGRGHPLWIPQPNIRLPTSYRAKGVCIGDVGIITPDGAFDFLFNICLPSTDPIHSDQLPEGFTPLYPPLGVRDIRAHREFTNGSYLASSSVSKVHHSQTERSVLAFESAASEGAILTMPEGAFKEELNNVSKFRKHIAAHAESWYRFVNGPCGREAQNGDLRLVIGCDKTTYWGMATFYNLYQKTNFRLNYVSRRHGSADGQRAPGDAYSWEHTGSAEVRVGPDVGENDDLISEPGQLPLLNQCLFLRTLTISLSDGLWQDLQHGLGAGVPVSGSSQFANDMPLGAPQTSDQSGGTSMRAEASRQGAQSSQLGKNRTNPSTAQTSENVVIRASTSESSRTQTVSKVVNDLLLQAKPEAKVAITNDKNWFSLSPSDLSSSSLLIRKIRQINDINISNGVVYLEPKDIGLDGLSPQSRDSINRLVDGSMSIEEYLFGNTGGINERSQVVKKLQLGLLENFVVNSKMTLRKYMEGSMTSSTGVTGALESFLEGTFRENLDVKLRPGSAQRNNRTHKAFLEAHPQRFLSIDYIIRSIRMFEDVKPPVQLLPPETISDQRERISTYSTSTVVDCQISLLLNLANSLFGRYLKLHERDDLDQAIAYYEEAFSSTTPIATYRHVEAQLGLCSSLYQRLLLTEKLEDLLDLMKHLDAQATIHHSQIMTLSGDPKSSKIVPKHMHSWDNDLARESTESLFFPELSQRPFSIIISPDLTHLMGVESRAANIMNMTDVPEDVIRQYLNHCFQKIKEAHPQREALVRENWPEDLQIETLVKSASKKFIYPITVMRYVSSPHYSPANRLLAVIDNVMLGGGIRSLYSMIIHAIPNSTVNQLFDFLAVCGDFKTSPRNLDEYLFLNAGDTRHLMLDLDPFVELMDEETPIGFRHPLFSNLWYVDISVAHTDSVYLCIRHLKKFHESGYVLTNLPSSLKYSINHIIRHLKESNKTQFYAQSLRSEVYDVPYVQCLLNGTTRIEEVQHPTQLLCQFLQVLDSGFSHGYELYLHHRGIWDQALLECLSKLPLDLGMSLCIALVATQWSIVDPLDILRHISAIIPSQRSEDVYSFGEFLYCLKEGQLQTNWRPPKDEYRQFLLDFFFDSSRSGTYYLDQSKFATVAKALIDFMVRPWNKEKRDIQNSKTWKNILLTFSQILKHIGYRKELLADLAQPKLLFRLPYTEDSQAEMSKHIRIVLASIEDYVSRNGTDPSSALRIIILDDTGKTLAEF